ncbi:MAG: DUF4124 domain-containing protein [Pseudomonadota bacterium]
MSRSKFHQFIQVPLSAVAILSLALAMSSHAMANVYKWVDEEGNIHYGDKPPAKVESAHSVLNERGLEVDSINRAKTDEEVAAELAEAEAIREQQLEEQRARHRDNILLETFTTERDLLLTRDDRLQAIDGAILLSEKRINSWSEKLGVLEKRIANYEKDNVETPARLIEERELVLRQIDSSETYMLQKMEERERTADQFEQDLARYRELKDDS